MHAGFSTAPEVGLSKGQWVDSTVSTALTFKPKQPPKKRNLGCQDDADTNSKGVTKKKRFHSDEATGAFFTPEEAALERAKFIAKKSGRLEPAFTCDMCSP